MNRLVLWGGLENLDSLRHIQRHYHNTARKMGLRTVWLRNEPASRNELQPGDVVFTADVIGFNIGQAVPDVNYVIHNFDGSHELCQTVEPHRLLRLQVYTNDAFGEEWGPFRRYHRESQILFQPWGTDLLPEEFDDPVFNATSNEVVFVGAVWSDVHDGKELGNKAMIAELKVLCRDNRLTFTHLTHVSDEENWQAVRRARLAPAFTGPWQAEHNYLPCRLFKNVSYGQLGVTNVPALAERVGCPAGTVAEQFDWAMSVRRGDIQELVREQQRFVAYFSYRDSINAINRALTEQNAF